jgi:LPXTG-motif cell wall-anchored protein
MSELLSWCADGLITDVPSVMAELTADMADPCIDPAQVTSTSSPTSTPTSTPTTTLGPAPATPRPSADELPRTGSNAYVSVLAVALIAAGSAGLALSSRQQARARRS